MEKGIELGGGLAGPTGLLGVELVDGMTGWAGEDLGLLVAVLTGFADDEDDFG